jgi:EmrB/QacA subfamily drug resistance transporter
MCTSLVLVVAAVSALNLALPNLAVDLGASNSTLTWIADGYTVALAALVLPLGALGDRLGRRNVLVAGTAVFGAASLAAAAAGTTTELIACRVVMGVGAAMIMPGTLSTITASFPEEQRRKGIATWSGFAAAGAIIGLLVAGGLLQRWGWSSIFVVTAAVAAIAGVLAAGLAPNTKEATHGHFDLLSSIALVAAIGGLVFAIIEGNETGWTRPSVLGALAISLSGFVTYTVGGLRHETPLLDPRLFRLRGFRAGTVTIVVQFMAIFGFFFVGLQYLQLVLGYSPLKSAIALVPVAVVVLPTSQLTPRLVRRFGLKWVMSTGLLLLGAGMFAISRLDINSGYLPFLVGLIVSGLGIGLASSTGTSAIVSSLPRDKQGVASAMNDTTREVGSAIGIAVMGSVYGSHYRQALPAPSPGTPARAVDAIRSSAAAGLEVAKKAGPLRDQITHTVRIAFMHGLSASLQAIAVILAIAAATVLVRAPGTERPAGRVDK